MPLTKKPSAEDLKIAKARAQEWKLFRRAYLYSQGHLANALHCGKRTVASIESGREVMRPSYGLLRRFRDLKWKHDRAAAARAEIIAPLYSHADVNQLFERRA
jgi:hypothetical protein